MKATNTLSSLIALVVFVSGTVAAAPVWQAQPTVEKAGTPPATASRQPSKTDALGHILQIIAERSPDVLAAQAAQRQSQAQVEQARAAWFGRIDAYAVSQHYNDPRLTRPITQPPNVALYPFGSDQFGYGVEVQLPLDISGQIASAVDAARSHANAARWSAEDVSLRALLQGAALFRNLQALTGQRAALDKQLASLQASERVARKGLAVGTIARLSLLQVQAALSEVQASIANANGQERKIRFQLAALMGIAEFSAPIAPPDGPPAAPATNPDLAPPRIEAAQSALQASRAKMRTARRALYPQFFINGNWNRNAIQWNEQSIDTWQISMEMRVNIWSGGAQSSGIDAAQAAEDEARQRLQSARDNLRAAREGAVALWQAQDQAYHAALAGLNAAQESAHIEQDRFRSGLGSATELIDAEAALARSRATCVGALASWWQADDALRYAYGAPPLAYGDAEPSSPHDIPHIPGAIQP